MQLDTTFILSDASYSHGSKVAGLGVVDLRTGESWTKTLNNIESSNLAELEALKFAIQIALKSSYKNVVFVYDNISVATHILKERYKKNFHHMQFLWLKRKFLQKSDDIAKKARVFQENFLRKCNPSIKIKPIKTELTDNQIIQKFKDQSIDRAFIFYMLIANEMEKKILKAYLKNRKDSICNIEINQKSGNFFNFIYYMIEDREVKNDFFDFIKDNLSHNAIKDFKLLRKKGDYMIYLQKIIQKLKEFKGR